MVAADRLNSRYALERQLGQGGSGAVWLVRDAAADDARRALKLLTEVGDGPARARLVDEFARLAALDHPRLVRVHEIDTVERVPPAWGAAFAAGTPFFTADLIDGVEPVAAVAASAAATRASAALLRTGYRAGRSRTPSRMPTTCACHSWRADQ
jgi:hypothetical protein